MYCPDKIKITNFGSIKNLEYTFQKGVSQIIQGKNLDDRGQKSNGVGKSSFNDAIAFSITGISLRNVSNDEMIRDDEDESNLELQLTSKDGVNTLLIKRFLYRKKSQEIEIWLNGFNKHKDLPGVNERNQFIIDEIGISKDDLFQFFLITKARYKPYFKLSDTEKKNITSRFSKADVVDKVTPLIERDLNITQSEINSRKTLISNVETKKITYQEEIVNLDNPQRKADLKVELSEKIDDQQIKKDKLLVNNEALYQDIKNINLLIQQQINSKISDEDINNKHKIIAELDDKLNNEQEKFDKSKSVLTAQVNEQEKDISELRESAQECNQGINEVKLLISQIESKLKSAIECPACNHSFILKSEATVDELKASLEESKELEQEIEGDLAAINNKMIMVRNDIKEIEAQIFKLDRDFRASTDSNKKQRTILSTTILNAEKSNMQYDREIVRMQGSINTINQDIQNNIASVTHIECKIKDLEQEILGVDTLDNSAVVKRYNYLILECDQTLVTHRQALQDEEEELQRLNAWILKFKAFKSYLANQSIKNIEDLTNFYLQKMNTDLSVQISGYQQKKKDIKEKITEIILRSGFPIGSYGRFSGGEQGRIDMGNILSNQTLINNNASPKGLDFILIDEVLDSLDSLGIESIIKAMDNIDKTLLLVTQNEINSLPSQTITLVKRNNSTEIE